MVERQLVKGGELEVEVRCGHAESKTDTAVVVAVVDVKGVYNGCGNGARNLKCDIVSMVVLRGAVGLQQGKDSE